MAVAPFRAAAVLFVKSKVIVAAGACICNGTAVGLDLYYGRPCSIEICASCAELSYNGSAVCAGFTAYAERTLLSVGNAGCPAAYACKSPTSYEFFRSVVVYKRKSDIRA